MKKKITDIYVFGNDILVYRGTKTKTYYKSHWSYLLTNLAIEKGFLPYQNRWDTHYYKPKRKVK
jgi:hypothetical protein